MSLLLVKTLAEQKNSYAMTKQPYYPIKCSSGIDRVSKKEIPLKNEKQYTRESQISAHRDSVGDDRGRFRCKARPQPQSCKQQKKGKIFTALAHGLEAFWKCFSVSPFLLPHLLSNQLSLPLPPASLDTHTPSNTDLPPTRTPPTPFSPSPLLERFNDLSFSLVHFLSIS